MAPSFRGERRYVRMRRLRGLAALSAVIAATLGLVASAHAAKGVVGAYGEGQFTYATGLAVNQASGDIYVADTGGQRVEQFTSSGDFVRAWGWGVETGANAFEVCTSACQAGIQGAGDGQFAFQIQDPDSFAFTYPQVAVDQADGSVYVVDTLNHRVQKFSATGAYLAQFGGLGSGDGQFTLPQGVAVDPVSNDVYVADTGNNRVQRFTDAGSFVSQVGTPGGSGDGEFLRPRRLATDSLGRLYVVDANNARIQRFAATGAFESVFGVGNVNLCMPEADIAIDLATDHVFVVGCDASFASGIVELDAAGQSVAIHRTSFFVIGGLGVDTSSGRLYASTISPAGGHPASVLVLDEVAPPTVDIEPVTDITATGFTAHATVNPEGPPVASYRVEYSTDGVSWSPAGADVEIGSGMSPEAIPKIVTGLDPNTEYSVRFVVTKTFDAAQTVSAEVSATTSVTAPEVRSVAAGTHSDTAAWLGGRVNPRNSATTAYVEYTLATDTAYAASSRIPLAPDSVDVGTGNEFVDVSQLVTGLQPATAYRFRVVATNVADTTFGVDRTFRTAQQVAAPPPGRGYEMVSPLDKNGGNVARDQLIEGATSQAAPSGDAVAFATPAQFADIQSGAPVGQYLSVRDPGSGWSTQGVTPRWEPQPVIDAAAMGVWGFSDDLTRSVVLSNIALEPGSDALLGASWGLYRQRNVLGGATDFRLITRPDDPLPPQEVSPLVLPDRFEFAAASSDLNNIVFESNGRQLKPEGLTPDTGKEVYVWANGEVRLVSMLPSGVPAQAAEAGAGIASGSEIPGDHLVSDDGQRIYFKNGVGEAPVYVRENGATTTLVSGSEADGDDPTLGRAARFQAAKADDGSQALVTSLFRLTNGATACDSSCPTGRADDLYLWDANRPETQRLKDLTTADPDGGGVLNVAAAAEDMSHVYFVATGVLDDGAQDGRPNLYEWSEPDGVQLIATLAPFATPGESTSSPDAPVWGISRIFSGPRYRDARISANGQQFLFASQAKLTPDGAEGVKQVYLYDSGLDRLTCVSCPSEDGVSGPSWLFYAPDLPDGPFSPQKLPRNLSADGTRVFFETANSLVSSDTNGESDVYQWSDGELSLVSSGRGPEGAKFVDASADGRDVFFTTREALVGSDVDRQVDLYDARVGGGFPFQELPPPCTGDACQPPTTAPPALSSAGSSKGAGNPPAVTRASFAVKRLTGAQRQALASGRSVSLSVRVNKAGRVTVRGVARVGKRLRTVISATRQARRAGQVKVPLRLSKAARTRLAASGRLKVSLRVRLAGADEATVSSIGLVRPASRKGR
jgi:sugar lactone lactonase YvrE